MQLRDLGRQGLAVPEIGYGAMGTAFAYGPTDDTASIAAIRRAHELGVTHFDTAEMYGWGAGEELLGHAVAPFRDEVTIATKFGLTPSFVPNSRPEHVREVVDASLRRLGVDVIDVLYQHGADPDVSVEEVVGVMAELVDAGKVRYLGLSNTDPDSVRRGHAVHPISVLQEEYSIFSRHAEATRTVRDELGIGLVAYSPLARGFLSGAVQPREQYDASDIRQTLPWWAPGNFERNLSTARELYDFAESKGATLSQLALAWLLAVSDNVVPIPGSRDLGRVEQNVAAADLRLDAADLDHIEQIAPGGAVGGRGM